MIAVQRVTGFCTRFADISTRGTDGVMHWGIAGHKIGCSLTNLDTIGHNPHMLCFDVFTALFKAMAVKCALARRTAFPAGFNTFFQIIVLV